MDMLAGEQIAAADLTDWRKLAQGLHARYLVSDYSAAARFVAAIADSAETAGHHPHTTVGDGYVDLKLVSTDAVYRDSEGAEHIVEWVTQKDVDLARAISAIAADHALRAEPSAVSQLELGLDTVRSETIAPVWAALLTGRADSQGRGTPGDEIRDATERVPHLWFGEDAPAQQRVHIEVYVAPECVADRLAMVQAAGGTIVDDADAPGMTVVSDQDGNIGVLCADISAAAVDATATP
ncbi:4a-hydroxytetrahydrobiopterin dehydratase [Microbacterium bovistercoris]|uniref:Putative pterin-4-alpha-carbinolamine dehydratase n=1 Tax=Microbacterium bovistercoris TaxID=2293570 RepID=A0A371NT60_9MICO|nr:4a-hydroxytetrahydrobiopterin dehydratase [Microbacterium bovistercoris]REJ05441.1 4a-hydroxytetrahydrobiopterin dehydratase [Microbacterium bovistercoris]